MKRGKHKLKVFWIPIILITVGVMLVVSNAEAKGIDCDKHPIYCQIKKNAPRMNSKRAMHISNAIHKVSEKYNLPTRIFVGILAQESAYRLGAKGCHRGLVKEVAHVKPNAPMSVPPVVKHIEKRVCSDFGIGQIYYKTAKGFGFDIAKLTTDLEYSLEASAKVLADFKRRYSAREVDWWTRYNASSRVKRKIYKQLVERYF